MLISWGFKDVDYYFFKTLFDNSLVYNGRLIVNN